MIATYTYVSAWTVFVITIVYSGYVAIYDARSSHIVRIRSGLKSR